MSELPLLGFIVALAGLVHLGGGWLKERYPWWDRQGPAAHAALGIAILSGFHFLLGHLAVVYGPGEVRSLQVLPAGPGPLLVVDEVCDPRRRGLVHGRLTLLDVESGRRLTRRILTGPVRYLGGGPDLFWLERTTGIEARDPRSLKVLATEKELIKRHPLLKRGLGVHTIEPGSGALVVPVEAGQLMRLAAPALSPMPVTGGAGPAAVSSGTSLAAGLAARLADGRDVRVGEASGPPIRVATAAEAATAPAPATLPEARLLLADDGLRALELDSPASVLLAQPAGPKMQPGPRLKRLALDGKLVWEAATPAVPLQARLLGPRLLVVAGSPGRLVALDAASGRELWRHRF